VIRREGSVTHHLERGLCQVACQRGCWQENGVKAQKKVTVVLSDELLERAQQATGEGITPTIRRGLELVAAQKAFTRWRKLRGKVRFSIDVARLREDRA
jgi:hypothetical protein